MLSERGVPSDAEQGAEQGSHVLLTASQTLPANQILLNDEDADQAEKEQGLGLEPPFMSMHAEPSSEPPQTAPEETQSETRTWRKAFVEWMYPLSVRPARPGTPRLDALDAARWFASIQIVGYHFYGQELGLSDKFLWGGYWTQFFFMLSGFVLAYAEMARPARRDNKVSVLQYLRKRMVVIYPSYLASLLLTMFTVTYTVEPFQWAVLPLHFSLMQSWLPLCHKSWECAPWQWNTENWFISCLVVFWLLLRPITNVVRYTSLRVCWIFLASLMVAVSGLFALTPLLFGDDELRNSRITVVVRATPVGYIHTFVGGIACARIFILMCMHDAETLGPVTAESQRIALDSSKAPCVFRFGCCLGYLVYILLLAFSPYSWVDQSTCIYYFFHNGGLMPVMGLVLLGAAVGVDPLAEWVFKSHPFMMLGRISYLQYLFQRVIWQFLLEHMDVSLSKWLYPFVLIAWAYGFQRWVEAPLTDWQRGRMENDTKGTVEKIIDWMDGMGNTYRTLLLCFIVSLTFVPGLVQLVSDLGTMVPDI